VAPNPGHDIVIVSASPQLYVDVMTEQLGANVGLGTRLASIRETD